MKNIDEEFGVENIQVRLLEQECYDADAGAKQISR